ncbi:MAG TPA: E3 binding domain-containing protein, partial [Steroidobacteraceae bacterium]|nr:E3 binding domain-containing protein [Steroidobacteraceae bacterium]
MQGEFHMPALGADMEEGTVVQWNVAPGDAVKRGQVVAVVETDKGAIDVEIFEDGVVREIVVQPGTRVPVGTLLMRLNTAGGATEPSAGVPAATPAAAAEPRDRASAAVATGAPEAVARTEAEARVKISPAARARSRELGVDVAIVKGTGPGGAITIEDVEKAKAAGAVPNERSSMRDAIAAAMSKSKR